MKCIERAGEEYAVVVGPGNLHMKILRQCVPDSLAVASQEVMLVTTVVLIEPASYCTGRGSLIIRKDDPHVN
jgi:hypothetical protein